MDRSLKWRTAILAVGTIFFILILLPSFIPKQSLPKLPWPANKLWSSKMSLGLDLQGGLHLVYSIDLDKAIDDRASEIKRSMDSRFTDEKVKGAVKTPAAPVGAVTVLIDNAPDVPKVKKWIEEDHGKDITYIECSKAEPPNTVCFRVSSTFGDSLKKDALSNAVSTIRERINEKGVAEPNVVEKGDQIIVELPGLDDEQIQETKDIIARTAKLEMKVVDDCTVYSPTGCTASNSTHDGSPYMKKLFSKVGSDTKGNPTDPDAAKLEIRAEVDQWRPDEGGAVHTDYYLIAPDREETVPLAWAKKHGCINKESVVENGTVRCNITGRQIIERYVYGDPELGMQGLIAQDPSFKAPDDRQLGFEPLDVQPNAKDKRHFWRTYYLERAVRLTGSAISNAMGSYDPNTNRPVVLLDFNRFGGRIFGDVTAQIVGMKFATILDDKVKSAPIINGAIRGGRASITMGGGNVDVQEREREELVAVLKTGSLPAPLREESSARVGPSLGMDAIAKTRLSFILGIALVILIMVGIYRWSGMIAVFAVVFHIVVTLAVMALFGATLTLPGIAAIVLSIGMEVDGNILIYERIREELLQGKSVRGAIDLGFSRAFSAILDGQLTTAAAGWVLLNYGSGPIKGFAVMLLVGVFTTVTTNIWVTRILFDWVVTRKKGQLQSLSI
ncbi:MAG TPA: protein translocase subunit SecD [Kofleriaceae bacterium]|nr:protein translocase subunit SecD [Kofleriaceae bacterium]